MLDFVATVRGVQYLAWILRLGYARVTAANLMLTRDVHAKVVLEMLGHTSVRGE
jgi:hypothetical protein